jgi:hypothetical protein
LKLFLDLLLPGFHNKRQQTFHSEQSKRERVGTFGFRNSQNDIIPLLSDISLNENEPNMKMILKTKILETFSAKCDNF